MIKITIFINNFDIKAAVFKCVVVSKMRKIEYLKFAYLNFEIKLNNVFSELELPCECRYSIDGAKKQIFDLYFIRAINRWNLSAAEDKTKIKLFWGEIDSEARQHFLCTISEHL